MPMTFYTDADADLSALAGLRIGVLGYGSQGHAHALNLRDSGCDVVVGLYPDSPSAAKAAAAGLRVASVAEVAREADVLSFQLPDERMEGVYRAEVAPWLRAGQALVFSHGYAIQYGAIVPPQDVDVLLVAPLGPGPLVRSAYLEGRGVPALFAVQQDASNAGRTRALAYAKALGATRAGVLESSFREETETDLFGEQVVLVGGVSELVRQAFATLVEAGYAPEVAYICCLHELKQTVELMQTHGLAGMNRLISNTAEFGSYLTGPRVVGEASRQAMREVLEDIQSGRFARAWAAENAEGQPLLAARRAETAALPLETIGAAMREKLGVNRR